MPRIKSAKKRVLVTRKHHAVNTARKSALKTAIKKVIDAIESNNVEQAKELFVAAESHLARAKGKGVLHANTAARKISRLAKRVVKAGKGQQK
jgi:small subunit ribosomal protein S20